MCKKTSHRNYGGTQYPKFILYTQKRFQPERKAGVIKKFIRIFRISDLNAKKILAALDNDEFLDFEDCLQEECAVEESADFIVTRNPNDFMKSRVKVLQPEEFLKIAKSIDM